MTNKDSDTKGRLSEKLGRGGWRGRREVEKEKETERHKERWKQNL